jgi:hypothetical protein
MALKALLSSFETLQTNLSVAKFFETVRDGDMTGVATRLRKLLQSVCPLDIASHPPFSQKA